MVRWASVLLAAWFLVAGLPAVAWAGMPTPVLTEWATMRFSTISFFVAALLVAAGVVKVLWNTLARDFSRLPRLSYGRSLALVVLWGFLFAFVLTMIAGARELMTPEAWERKGLTYKIAGQAKGPPPNRASPPRSIDARRRGIEQLKLALWDYALKHDGRFPEALDANDFDGRQIDVPGFPGLAYTYVPGQTAQGPAALLAFEPDAVGYTRLGLETDGSIVVLSGQEIRQAVGEEAER